MTQFKSKFSLALVALLSSGMLLGSCGSNGTSTPTSTPSSMLGTDSAATKVGGTMSSAPANSAGPNAPATTPAIGADTAAGPGR